MGGARATRGRGDQAPTGANAATGSGRGHSATGSRWWHATTGSRRVGQVTMEHHVSTRALQNKRIGAQMSGIHTLMCSGDSQQ